MHRTLSAALLGLVFVIAGVANAVAFGEGVLAQTGQYTFFIKPDPCSPVTLYQRMVPCVKRECKPIPRTVVENHIVPVPSERRHRMGLKEIPVGCPKGLNKCETCFPQPRQYAGWKRMMVPKGMRVPVKTTIYQPRIIDRRTTRPQWFAVTPDNRPIQKTIRKVGPRG